MSSWMLETYESGDIYLEYYWDKYAPHYHVFLGRKVNGVVMTIKHFTYATIEQAKRSFRREKRKLCM